MLLTSAKVQTLLGLPDNTLPIFDSATVVVFAVGVAIGWLVMRCRDFSEKDWNAACAIFMRGACLQADEWELDDELGVESAYIACPVTGVLPLAQVS